MAIQFKDLLTKIDGIKYRKGKEWEIFLPYDTDATTVHSIIAACRELLMVSWHIVFAEPTNKIPEPEIHIYWDN